MDRRLGRLVERADALAERADRLVASALRSVRGEMALLAEELNLGGSARDRERAEGEIRRRLAKLSKRLDALLSRQNELAAKAATSDASEMKGVEVEYSKSRAEAVCRLVSPAQGDSLAAVLTDRMAQSLVNALRSATVAALRQNAVEGGTLRDMGRDILSRWNAAASERPVFTDSSGRAWDTGRYVQMNARTNAMRVYNDCLADALARTGDDLARVSRGGDPTCDGCFPWEGVILSLTGKTKGFPTYEQARASGCFHPNCTHTLDPVDEAVDADEIALQRGHPLGEPGEGGGWSFDEADERRWEMDVDRKMLADPSLTREAAETAVNRDNLEANVRNGLVRADAGEIVAKLTDAQVSALCPGGNPPRFEPVKRVRGGTRKEPKFEEERWRRGSRGGVVHVRRDATAERIAEVCGVKDAEGAAKGADGWTPKTDLEKSTDALMKSIGARHTEERTDPLKGNPQYGRYRPSDLRKAYCINCQRCVPTAEARFRGYDVTSLPRKTVLRRGRVVSDQGDELYKGLVPLSDEWLFPQMKGAVGIGYKRKSDIEAKMREWGDGARAQIVCKWKGGGAHTFMAVQENGATRFIDPQIGANDCSAFFDRVSHRGYAREYNKFARIDNLEFNERIKLSCKPTSA